MKKIFLLAGVLCAFSCATAQFPGTDSLHRYNNRYIRNSPLEAFNNLRLNTLIHGIIQWIDSARAGAGGALGIDTAFAVNDSTFRYKKNGNNYTVVMKGIYDVRRKVDSGYVYNDSIIRLIINGANRDFLLRGKDVRKLTDSTIKIGPDTMKVGGTFVGGGGGSIDSLKQVKDTDVEDPYLGDALIYDSIARKWKSVSVRFKSLIALLYAKDTLGVKIVESFHKGYNHGGFKAIYVSGATPDYITSWPSKNFSGAWVNIDYQDEIFIDQLGALGTKATRITAATLGYSSDDLTDLYGAYFTKSTSDYADVLALNQSIKALGISGKYYRWIKGGSNTYYVNKNLERFPNYVGANVYDQFGFRGNNTIIQSYSGKYNIFTRIQTNYSGEANNAVSNKYAISGVLFRDCDTAIALNSSYNSTVADNIFFHCNFSVCLKWNLGTNVTNNRFDGYDSVALYIGHVPGFADLSSATASAYSYVVNNRFFASNWAKKGIFIDQVNGVYIEQPIFEGGNPDYNVYIKFNQGNFPFHTNTREMKIMGGHLENQPDSACIYYDAGGEIYLYLEKMYLQTAPAAPFVWAKGENSGSRARVVMNNMPYLDPGTYPNKMFRSEFCEWYFNGVPSLKNALQDTTYWYGAVLPEVLHAEANSGSVLSPYVESTTALVGSVTGDINGYYIGNKRYFGTLRVPNYTDASILAGSNGALSFNTSRNKFYVSHGTDWRWLVDSSRLYGPSLTATGNNQILASFPLTGTFSAGGFTGTTYRTGQFISNLPGLTHQFYIANNGSTASSRVQLQLLSNNGGVTNFWSDGRIITSGTDITLTPANTFAVKHTLDGSIKLTHNATGLRIGDATAPVTNFEIAGTAAMLLPRGTTAQRPTGVNGYFRSNADSLSTPEYYGNSTWNLLASRQWVRDNFSSGSSSPVGASSTPTDSAGAINRATGLWEMRPIAGGAGGASGDGTINGTTNTFERLNFIDDNGDKFILSSTILHHIIIRSSVGLANLKIGTTNGGSEIWSGAVTADDVNHANDINLQLGTWFPNATTLYFTGIDATGADVKIYLLTDKWNAPVAP